MTKREISFVALVTGGWLLIASSGISQQIRNAVTHGSWRSYETVDVIDDSVELVATAEGEDASLAVVCRPGGILDFIAAFDFRHVSGDTSRAVFRVDSNTPIQQVLPVTFTGEGSRILWRTPGTLPCCGQMNLIEQMRAGTVIYARTWDSADLPITKEFSLSGFTAASQAALDRCEFGELPDELKTVKGVYVERGVIFVGTATLRMGSHQYWAAPNTPFEEDLLGTRNGPALSTDPRVPVKVLRSNPQFSWYLIEFGDGAMGWIKASSLQNITAGGTQENRPWN